MASSDQDEIDLLISDIVEASKTPAKTRATNIRPTVSKLTSLIYEKGLLPASLHNLIELLATPSHLDQASLAAIARNLYPATRVSKNVVFRVIGALGHGALKPSLNLQAALLKWLVMVYHVLESQSCLAQAYSVMFNLLDTAAIRPQLCHILALITRRKHVRPFRIRALLELSRQTGNDPNLVGLLRVFKDYYPEIIVGEAVRGKSSAFKHPDPAWRERLHEIQEAHFEHMEETSSSSNHAFRVNRPVHRQRQKFLPRVHTSHVTERSVTLEEIENVTSFVRHLDKIELPNQLAAVLADPLLQKLLLLRPNAEASQRVANWLSSVFQEVIDGDADEATLWDALEMVGEYVVKTKTFPPGLLAFLARFLRTWNGSGRRDLVFAILTHVPFIKFSELQKSILQPFEEAVLDNTPESLVALLTMYSNLLHNWTAILLTSPSIPSHASRSGKALVRHVGQLCLTLLQAAPTASVDSQILSFYEQTTRLRNDEKLSHHVRIELPPSALIYILLFSGSVSTVSRLCHILADIKKGFEAGLASRASRRDSSPSIGPFPYDKAYVNKFNGYMMDICNCFWRARAFSDTDTNAHGCMVPRRTVARLTSYVASVDKSFSLSSMFSLSHSPVLCLQSIQRVRELEDEAAEKDSTIRTRHAGPVTQSSLSTLADSGGISLSWQEYRVDILRTLEAKGLGGIGELLKNTMTVLKQSMDTKPGATTTEKNGTPVSTPVSKMKSI